MRIALFLCAIALSGQIAAQKPELIVRQEGHISDPYLVCFSSDEQQALSADDEGIVLWDLKYGKFVRYIPIESAPVSLRFSPTGESAHSVLKNHTMQAWDLATGKRSWRVPKKPADTLTNVQALPNKQLDSLYLFDFQNKKNRLLPNLGKKIAQTGMPLTDYDFSRDGNTAVISLGVPTALRSVTPGLPANRDGKGGLLVWDVQNDRLLRQMEGITEIIQAVTMAADGCRCLTVSADKTVRLWDVLTGKELLRLQREPAVEHNLRITPDFKRLAVTDYDGAFNYWEMDQRSELVAYAPNRDEASYYSARDFDAIELDASGKKLLTASRNFSLNLWNSHPLNLLGKLEDRHDCLWVATAMDISPDGKKALVGSSPEWRVMSRKKPTEIPRQAVLEFITNNFRKDTIGVVWRQPVQTNATTGKPPAKLAAVATRTYGDVEVTGDMVVVEPNYFNVSLWDLENMRSVRIFKTGATDWHPISDVRFSADGRMVIATVQGNMMAWDIETGDRIVNAEGVGYFHAAHLKTSPKRVATIGADSTDLTVWNLTDGKTDRRFTGSSRFVAAGFGPSGRRLCTLEESGNLTEWDVQTGVIHRQVAGAQPGQTIQYAPDTAFVLIRGEGTAAVWNLLTGRCVLNLGKDQSSGFFRTQKFYEAHGAEQISQFKFMADGTRAWSANYDGTLRGWDINTGQNLFTIYFPGEKDWVVTAPSGLFDASPGAMRLLYFVVGTEVIDLEQLKERYFEPGLLQKMLGQSAEPLRSVTGFDSVALYPKVRLLLDTLQKKLTIALSPRNGGVGKVSVFINSKEIVEDANPLSAIGKVRDTVMVIDLGQYARFFLSDSLNIISVRAYNEAGWLKSGLHNVEFRPATPRAKGGGPSTGAVLPLFARDPALYVLAVGTANYAGTELDLRYSGKDARDMVVAVGQIGKQLFRDSVFITLLTTDTSNTALQPTKVNIQKAFEAIKKSAKAEDILFVYFSGHGIAYGEADRALFYYLTQEIGSLDLSDPGVRDKRAVSSNELTRWINDIPALKQVLILDACNSGKILESLSGSARSLGSSQIRALDRMKDRTGMFVLTGSAADKLSYEAGEFEQGLLTYSILQFVKTLGSKGDRPVDVMSLFQYACDKVPELARGIGSTQKPLPASPLGGASFDIGIVNENVKIPLAEKKKVYIRSVFQDEKLGDELNLAQEAEKYFQEITAQGDKLIYLDINAYENGYSVRGRYRVVGETVKLTANLFRNNKALSPTPTDVEGKKNALQELLKATMRKLAPLMKTN